MRKHTAGPWEARSANLGVQLIFSADGQVVGCASNVPPSGQAHINARLIAAAPDLLAALERLLGNVSKGNEVWHDPLCHCVIHEARAAIAKAKEVP